MLAKTTLSALDTHEAKERLFATGVEIRPTGADESESHIKSEVEKWSKVIKAAGLQPD